MPKALNFHASTSSSQGQLMTRNATKQAEAGRRRAQSVGAHTAPRHRLAERFECVLITPGRFSRQNVNPASSAERTASLNPKIHAIDTSGPSVVRPLLATVPSTPLSPLAGSRKRKRGATSPVDEMSGLTRVTRSASGLPTPANSQQNEAPDHAKPVSRSKGKDKQVLSQEHQTTPPERVLEASDTPLRSASVGLLSKAIHLDKFDGVTELASDGYISAKAAEVSVDFELQDVLEAAYLPWRPTTVPDLDGHYDSPPMHLPPAIGYIIEVMGNTVRAERLARLKSEARYERELRMRVDAEERLQSETEQRLEAEHEVARLRPLEEAREAWTDAAAQAFAKELVAGLQQSPSSGMSSAEVSGALLGAERAKAQSSISSSAESKGKQRMSEDDRDRAHLSPREYAPNASTEADRTAEVLERAAVVRDIIRDILVHFIPYEHSSEGEIEMIV